MGHANHLLRSCDVLVATETNYPPFRFESGHPILDNKNYEESIKAHRCRAERDRYLT
jgi:hypothetical protein